MGGWVGGSVDGWVFGGLEKPPSDAVWDEGMTPLTPVPPLATGSTRSRLCRGGGRGRSAQQPH